MSTKTYDNIHFIISILLGVGIMLLFIYSSGKVYGLTFTVIFLFGETAHLSVRCTALQRQVNTLFQQQDRIERSLPDTD